MRNAITALICFMMTFVTYANVTDSTNAIVKGNQIYTVILASKEANVPNGITDPNNILPGQTLTFRFADGSTTTHTVSAGETQWKIVDDLLTYGVPQHGPIVNYNDSVQKAQVTPIPVYTPNGPTKLESALAFFMGVPWWVYALLVTLGVIVFLIVRNQLKNPVTSGTPFFAGGITEGNLVTAMRQIAERQFGPNVRIISTEHGFLNGRNVLVNYGGIANAGWFTRFLQWIGLMPKGNWRRRTFVNFAALRATVIINNNPIPQQVYGLLECGNDVRQGDFFTGNIQFTATEIPQVVPDPATQQGGNQTAITTADELTIAVNSLPTAIGQLQKQGGGTMCITTPTVAIDVQVAGEQKITINEKVEIHVFHTTVEPSKNGKVEEPKKETAEQPVDKN